jgi:hypothetical protein
MDENIVNYLKEIYYDVSHPASFSGISKLYSFVKKENKYKIKLRQLKEWLSNQRNYTIFKPIRRKFKRQRVYVNAKDHIWDLDTVNMKKYGRYNKNFSYILICIDILSRFLITRPLKSLKGVEMVEVFKDIFSNTKPKILRHDKGTEFENKFVKQFLKERNIRDFSTTNEVKSSYAERVIQTLKGRIMKYMNKNQTNVWYNILEKATSSYNASNHKSIKMSPNEARNTDDIILYKSQYFKFDKDIIKKRKYILDLGDKVRISHLKLPFERHYSQKWTEETFIISERFMKQFIPLYRIKDWNNQAIDGTFYEEELLLYSSSDQTQYLIDKIIRQRVRNGEKEYLVRWKGYSAKFDSWVKEKDMSDEVSGV